MTSNSINTQPSEFNNASQQYYKNKSKNKWQIKDHYYNYSSSNLAVA